ncbi:MAG: hypothetical protein ILA11_05645 [Butyrivibrio sp.]|nr:hypothetical protein [Butyrivibrio sp.]
MKRQDHLSRKNKGTFIIKVEDCQRGTWQGKVVWADEETTEYFRSALELLQLVDEALNAARGSDKQAQKGSA